MSFRALCTLLGVYIALVGLTATASFFYARGAAHTLAFAGNWRGGRLLTRTEQASCDMPPSATSVAQINLSVTRCEQAERIAPLPAWLGRARGLWVVPARDGLRFSLGQKSVLLTPDDLLAAQLYEKSAGLPELGLGLGVDLASAAQLAAERWNLDLTIERVPDTIEPTVTATTLLHEATIERVQFALKRPVAARPTVASTAAELRAAADDGARFLARNVDDSGLFGYLIDGPKGARLDGYSWPRHAGSTLFLAEAYRAQPSNELRRALLLTARRLVTESAPSCGGHVCLGPDEQAVGTSALALIALVAIGGLDIGAEFRVHIASIAEFLRTLARADGEFMHVFDRAKGHPVNVQVPFVSGEVVLALSRAYAVTHNPDDLIIATHGLDYLVQHAWSFFGDRYFVSEEHWTCQAMNQLWESAPNRAALDFCVRWHRVQRAMQYKADETPWNAEGAFGVGPLFSPKTTPTASRVEAAVATLVALRKARPQDSEAALLLGEIEAGNRFLLTQQWRPGPTYLQSTPVVVHGAMPGGVVDYQLRNDYVQHAGCAMLRTASYLDGSPGN